MGLSNKRKAFIQEYLKDFNGTRAAIRAGYSERSAGQIADAMLKKHEVQEEVRRLIDERMMTDEELKLRLADHARGDMQDILDIGSMGFVVDLNKAVENGKTHLIKKIKMRTTTTVNKDGVETETHDVDVELYDAQGAMEKLARIKGMFTDKSESTVTLKIPGLDDGLRRVYDNADSDTDTDD